MLDDFLHDNRITLKAAGDALGVSAVAVYEWVRGTKRPRDDNRNAISVWTGGAVPADSWRTEEPKSVEPFAKTGTDGE